MSLNYPFPRIHHITDVLRYILDDKAFIIVPKDAGYTVINYVQAGKDTFPTVAEDYAEGHAAAIRRECRGIIFDSHSGEVISRPYHKFFNLGERDDLIPFWEDRHAILEKLDGSMVRPLLLNGGIRWATKMGITEVSMQAEEFVAKRRRSIGGYESLAHYCFTANLTPIFEWCSRQQRIVVDYPEDRLVLTAARHNNTGAYMGYRSLVCMAEAYGVEVVRTVDRRPGSDFDLWVRSIREQDEGEGVVVRFEGGHMLKIKADAYVTMHRAKDAITGERSTLRLVLEEKIDDLMPLLSREEQDRLHDYSKRVFRDLHFFADAVRANIRLMRSDGVQRRDAASLMENRDIPSTVKSCVFHVWGYPDEDVWDGAWTWGREFLLRNSGSNDSLRNKAYGVLQTARWEEKEAA